MSCRRGIKDGDCGCCKSLAAKVRELYQRCANAIKSINGINPDGANNFDILPGAGIQVNPRANGIEIESLIDDSDKVDKLETAGDYAYTHNGSTQGETALVDGTTADTIPIRDGSGYIKAESPATGVYDTNLANGIKIKNELDNYAPMVRTTGNQTIAGNKTFSIGILGTIALMRNKNINNVSVKVGLASGTGAYKYGSVFYIVTVRNVPYFVTMYSGSSAPKHDTISILNLSTGLTVNTSDLDWKMGYYIDADSQIFVTITGPAANRITWAHFIGGSQGGSSGLLINPTSNDTVPTADVVTFW